VSSLLELENVTVDFSLGSALVAKLQGKPAPVLRAVDRVSLTVKKGESIGIVGESGCGKSTLAQVIVGLQEADQGCVRLEGQEIKVKRPGAVRRRIQMVFQDPGSSLNPRLTVEQTLTVLLKHYGTPDSAARRARCEELLSMVGLSESVLEVKPRSLSGGQRQRVAIARALAVEPDILIADEAVAALDVSVQASILALLNRLRRELDLTLVFISHDLAVVRQVCSRVAVIYLGRVVEDRPAEDLFDDPQHPYTRALMAAAPKLGVVKTAGSAALKGEAPSAMDRPSGCRFRSRCPASQPICAEVEPDLEGPAADQLAACHFAWSGTDPGQPQRVASSSR